MKLLTKCFFCKKDLLKNKITTILECNSCPKLQDPFIENLLLSATQVIGSTIFIRFVEDNISIRISSEENSSEIYQFTNVSINILAKLQFIIDVQNLTSEQLLHKIKTIITFQ